MLNVGVHWHDGQGNLPDAMEALRSADEIRDVNTRYHDVAAHSYDSKWGIDFGPIGQAQVLGKLRKLLGDELEQGYQRSLEIGAGTGYFSLNLLTSSSQVEADKAVAHTLLAALSYNAGKGYEDFNVATDHIAAYGIAALVGGVVAKKLGLLALIGVFVLKFAKVIGIAVLAFGAGIFNFFRRKPKSAGASGNAPPNG